MAKLKLATTPYCTCALPREAEIGWERAAYLQLEQMQAPQPSTAGRRYGSRRAP